MAEINIDSEYENVHTYSDLRMETRKSHAYTKYKGIQQSVEQPPNPVTDGPGEPDGPETKKEIISIRKLLVLLSIFILLLVIVVIVCVVVMLSWRYEMDNAKDQRKLGK